MAFVPPVVLIRKMRTLKLLEKCGAYSPETAKYLDEIGLVNPYAFPGVTRRLVKSGRIIKTDDGKYYINRNY